MAAAYWWTVTAICGFAHKDVTVVARLRLNFA
jgi:hypothetical protein